MQTLVNYIIRPKRNTYDPNLHLGPAVFLLDNSLYCGRMDFEVKNRKGKTLKCSIYHRNIEWNKQYPLIVYCHGNSGNRTDSFGPLYWMLKNNIFLLAFDFSGCGISEGDYVSLGYYEHFDIEDVLNHVLENYDFIDVKKFLNNLKNFSDFNLIKSRPMGKKHGLSCLHLICIKN